jgi:molybdopterin molybdotransferase/putative molybdopterin biosynthesis protein
MADQSIRRARTDAGLSQSELARRAGISRQALGAIEAGLYQPSVAVALNLARELATTVETLFSGDEAARLSVNWVGDNAKAAPAAGTRVALARVNGKLIATPQPLSTLSLAPAAGMIGVVQGRRVRVETFRSREDIDSTLLLAGCDPGVAILADWMTRHRCAAAVIALPCSSGAALEALLEGRAHVAGVHLRDPRSGDYNVAPVRRRLGRRRATFVNFSSWEIGLAISPRKRGAIRAVEDLARPGITIVNRERGSGARHALDDALAKAGIASAKIRGYARELGGHLEVAAAIGAAEADAGVTIRVAAEAYALDFIPIREERYDFVIPENEMELPAVRAMMDALNSSRFSRELARLCAYDTRRTGSLIDAAPTAG